MNPFKTSFHQPILPPHELKGTHFRKGLQGDLSGDLEVLGQRERRERKEREKREKQTPPPSPPRRERGEAPTPALPVDGEGAAVSPRSRGDGRGGYTRRIPAAASRAHIRVMALPSPNKKAHLSLPRRAYRWALSHSLSSMIRSYRVCPNSLSHVRTPSRLPIPDPQRKGVTSFHRHIKRITSPSSS